MKTIRYTFLLFSLMSLLSVSACFGNEDEQLLHRADSAYQQENYADAITLYEQIAANGNEGSILFYNLGNAYYKNGDNFIRVRRITGYLAPLDSFNNAKRVEVKERVRHA